MKKLQFTYASAIQTTLKAGRIRAALLGGFGIDPVIMDWDNDLSESENHIAAATQLAADNSRRLNLTIIPTSTGYIFPLSR